MTRGERRKKTYSKALKRKQQAKYNCYDHKVFNGEEILNFFDEIPLGYFKNQDEANHYGGAGRKTKTNRRKGHGSYRSKLGQWGKDMNYKPHDQRQIDAERDQEYENND